MRRACRWRDARSRPRHRTCAGRRRCDGLLHRSECEGKGIAVPPARDDRRNGGDDYSRRRQGHPRSGRSHEREKDSNFLQSESPLFVGRAIAALAADPKVRARTGMLFGSWELGRDYGLSDYDGRRPDWSRHKIDFSTLPPTWIELFRTGADLESKWRRSRLGRENSGRRSRRNVASFVLAVNPPRVQVAERARLMCPHGRVVESRQNHVARSGDRRE